MRLASSSHDSLVIAQNVPAALHLERFLQGAPAEGTDLEAIARESRETHFRAMLAAYGADLSTGRPAPWNLSTRTFPKQDHIYGNTDILADEQLETVRRNLLRKLALLQSTFAGKAPIILTDYHDDSDTRGCFTTDMLRATLHTLLGDEGYARFVYDELRANFIANDRPLKGNPEKYIRRFNAVTASGGIVIGGGSFKDADDVHGQFFQEHIMTKLLDNQLLRGLMICWSYQVMARTFAKRYGLDLYVLRGSLHWGALPMKVLKDVGRFGRIFPRGDRAARIGHNTAMFTNGDHLVPGKPVQLGGKIVGRDPETGAHRFLKVIAVDPLNDGMPLAFQTDDERIIGFAGHPEVHMGDDVERIQGFAQNKIDQLLADVYQVSAVKVADNFNTRSGGRYSRNLLQRDLGPAFYAGILDSFADSLLRTFNR